MAKLTIKMNNRYAINNHNARTVLLIAIACAVGLLAITSQSLWMDEGSAAFKALLPTYKEWWQMTMRIGGSDTQMPVYMFLLWVWVKCGALSEFAMRAINLPWLAISVLAMRQVRYWPLVCLTSPFVLYYTGELRPYAMQIAGGALAALAIRKVIAGRDGRGLEGLHATSGASLLLACSSLTAAVWAMGLWIGVLIIRTDWLRRKDFWVKSFPWILGLLLIGCYYLFTLFKGYRATGVERGGVMSVFFGIYEMIGMLGLGPGKSELRSNPASALHDLPVLIPALACIAGAWLCGVRAWRLTVPARCFYAVIGAVAIPVLLLSTVGVIADFRCTRSSFQSGNSRTIVTYGCYLYIIKYFQIPTCVFWCLGCYIHAGILHWVETTGTPCTR